MEYEQHSRTLLRSIKREKCSGRPLQWCPGEVVVRKRGQTVDWNSSCADGSSARAGLCWCCPRPERWSTDLAHLAVPICTRAAIHLTGKVVSFKCPPCGPHDPSRDRSRQETPVAWPAAWCHACRDNRPRSSKENHRKTTPDRPTEASVGTNLRFSFSVIGPTYGDPFNNAFLTASWRGKTVRHDSSRRDRQTAPSHSCLRATPLSANPQGSWSFAPDSCTLALPSARGLVCCYCP